MAKCAQRSLEIGLFVVACTLVIVLGKGFDVNGEKDNGKRK